VDTPAGPPTPQPPLPVSPPKQKGYQSAPFKILHPSAYSSRPESEVLQSYGAKMETRTPMHIWPTRHPQLACTAPHCFHFFSIPLSISCWQNPGNLKWNAASLAWLTPRPAPERVCLWLLDMSAAPPPLTQFAPKGSQSTGLELRIPMIYLKFRTNDPVKFWRGGPINSGPPQTHPPLRLVQSIALDARISNIYNYNWFDMLSKSYASYTLLDIK